MIEDEGFLLAVHCVGGDLGSGFLGKHGFNWLKCTFL